MYIYSFLILNARMLKNSQIRRMLYETLYLYSLTLKCLTTAKCFLEYFIKAITLGKDFRNGFIVSQNTHRDNHNFALTCEGLDSKTCCYFLKNFEELQRKKIRKSYNESYYFCS